MHYSANSTKPAKLIAGSFASVIAVGMVLLTFPAMTTDGQGLGVVDALFTATSAVCVTGLVVVDTGLDLSRLGQIVVLLLIQIGGMGIMTFSLLFLIFLKVPTTLTARLAVPGLSSDLDLPNLMNALKHVVLFTLLIEAVGAALLFARFQGVMPLGEAAYFAIFYSVSAFCNAGFTLYSTSLEGFQQAWFIPGVVILLVVLGGTGFVVLDEVRVQLRNRFRGERVRMSLHTKICLYGTAGLLIGGFFAFWLFERSNTLEGMSAGHQALNALFASAAARTAGFNTVDTATLSGAGLLLMVILMFIGGCPGSTAGGIKVTTFLVISALIVNQTRGRKGAALFSRKIPGAIIGKALAIFAAGFLLVLFGTLALLVTETGGAPYMALPQRFIELFFEATSGFGTVGLTTGVTRELSAAGKLILAVLMFAGRIGPLTLGLAILLRRRRQIRYEYAEEDLMVG